MKNLIMWSILAIFVYMVAGCSNAKSGTADHGLNQTSPGVYSKMDIVPLLEKYEKVKFHLAYDVEVKKTMTYLGVKTKTIFTDLVSKYHVDTALYEVMFFCKDGYSPIVPLHQLLADNGYLAVKDMAAKGDWEDAMQEKFPPAYLVWDIPVDDHLHSFPYGVTGIQLVEKKMEYRLATPTTNEGTVTAGFALFKEKCIKCHSINTEGGLVGPELNFPKSVTEYWKTDQLKLFIKNPADFRHNSKMPFLALDDSQIGLIVNYLTFMAAHKSSSHD